MNFPNRETVEQLRREYPIGCRIVLDEMHDPFTKIPVGAQATCQGVDDAGNILCAWDCGSGLSIAFGADRCHKVRTEEEAKVTLEWYGKHQPGENARCPRCGCRMAGATSRHALKNAMVPILPMIISQFIGIMGGSFVIEKIFAIPGVGQLYLQSITLFDYDVFMVDCVFYVFIGLLAGIVVDLSYGFIDPRIRMGE